MELWIKTQEKRLVQIVDFLEPRESENGETYHLCGFSSIGSFIKLGIYENKERALEILDEIQEIVSQEDFLHIRKSSLNNLDDLAEPKYILRSCGLPKVYKMPQK